MMCCATLYYFYENYGMHLLGFDTLFIHTSIETLAVSEFKGEIRGKFGGA